MNKNGEVPSLPPVQDTPKAESQSRRNALKAAGLALGALFGMGAANTQTGQDVYKKVTTEGAKIMSAAPGVSNQNRPPVEDQLKEFKQNLDALDSSKKPTPAVEPTQQKMEADMKATLDANPANRNKDPFTPNK